MLTLVKELHRGDGQLGVLAFVPGLVRPFAVVPLSGHIDGGTLPDVLLGNVRLLAVEDDTDPLGTLLLLVVAVGIFLRNRDSRCGNLVAVVEVPDFRVCSDVANELAKVE